MKKMMKSLMLSCDKATTLVEKKIDVGLSFMEEFQLAFHTSMCDGCTNYQKQSMLIHKALRKDITTEDSMSYSISSQLKESILKRLNDSK